MIAFTDAQRSSAADQIQAYGGLDMENERAASVHCADLALGAVAEDVERLLRALKDVASDDPDRSWGSARDTARDALYQWQA